jgi:hypothetical protein
MNEDIVFYIPHYRSDRDTVRLLNYCVKSIRMHYPGSDIVVCESESSFEKKGYDVSGVIWIDNPIQNSATIGCVKDYINRYESTRKRAIFIQDTIILKGKFNETRLSRPFGFIWYFDIYQKVSSLFHDDSKPFLFTLLANNDMDYNDYVGCFGPTFYGTYTSIYKLWNSIPFDTFMKTKERSLVLQDLERIIGAVSFQLGLTTSIEDCSLCGDIFMFPGSFSVLPINTFEEIQKYPYKESAIKIWKGRTYNIGNIL